MLTMKPCSAVRASASAADMAALSAFCAGGVEKTGGMASLA